MWIRKIWGADSVRQVHVWLLKLDVCQNHCQPDVGFWMWKKVHFNFCCEGAIRAANQQSWPFSHLCGAFGCRERRNLLSTLAAERKKVILYCRREAVKRRTKDIAAGAKEARNMNAHK